MKKNKKIVFSLIGSLFLLILIGTSYAYIKLNKEETEVNVVGTDCISLEMIEESNAITIQNTFPVSDEVGKTTPPYVFKLKNECGVGINYEIQLEVEEGNTMEAKNVATMVDNKEKIVLTSEQKVKDEETKEKYKISETLSLEPYKEVEHEVRIWLDKDANNDSQNKKFLSKVIIEAVQNQSVCTYESKWEFDYENEEQTFTVPCDGVYLLEVWGAQGGHNETTKAIGGLGGYSKGEVALTASDTLYINVGGQGEGSSERSEGDTIYKGGYNGGGNGLIFSDSIDEVVYISGGGGATHIAKVKGLLSTLEEQQEEILLIAGGGGGSNGNHSYGGAGGGFKGTNGVNTIEPYTGYLGTGGSQELGGHSAQFLDVSESTGTFGQGGMAYNDPSAHSHAAGAGGGGGYYGGGGSSRIHTGGGGGSGYLNPSLSNKGMWCYECEENEELSTKTTSTTNVSEEAISEYAKQGNGFARITYLRIK